MDSYNSTYFERHSSDQCLYCLLPVFIVRLLYASVLLFDSVFIRSSVFFQLDSFVQCSNYSVYFLSSSWKIPGILIPSYTNHQAVNKHHTADSAIFCLSIGSERPITIIDIERYQEPISPNGISRWRDNTWALFLFEVENKVNSHFSVDVPL